MKKQILGVQISSTLNDRFSNYRKVENIIKEALSKDISPDIVVLPEVWTTGWDCYSFCDTKENDLKTEDFLKELAVKYKANIIGGSYIKETEDGNYNTCCVFLKNGEKLAEYKKIHLYSPDGEAKYVKSGDTPVIVEIEGLKIGLSICYDIRFPELYRSYINSKSMPELLINMSAWPKSRAAQYISMAQSRAIENQSYFLALSQTGLIKNDVYNAGNSLFVSPMGEIISKTGEEETYFNFEVDTDLVYKIRKTYPNLDNRKVFDFGFIPKYFVEKSLCSKK